MELRDFIVTPIVLILIYLVAYLVRPRFTDINTKRYFIPALTVRIIGAIAVGVIYQFYYGGGDTFTYHTLGSSIIWDAFMDSPFNGLRLLFAGKELSPELFKYTQKMWFFGDLSSYFVVRIAAIFDLLTFKTYSATAVLFACLSFTGSWALYQVFYQKFPFLHKLLAISIFFVPSVFFWGSGILKDTITLAALGWSTYAINNFLFHRKKLLLNTVLLTLSFYILFSVKLYILMCFIPALIIWWHITKFSSIRSIFFKIVITPFVLITTVGLAYWAVLKVGEGNPKYAIENLAQTAQVTAYDIAFWTGRNAGSTYSLGELDGTFTGMINLLPQAINVSLFRPYLWEVSNPLMLLAALESLCFLVLTLVVLYRARVIGIFKSGTNPLVFFCLTFAFTFAFAVGVSTFNFGTLMRYKIPLIPFYASALVIMFHYSKKDKKLSRLDKTE